MDDVYKLKFWIEKKIASFNKRQETLLIIESTSINPSSLFTDIVQGWKKCFARG